MAKEQIKGKIGVLFVISLIVFGISLLPSFIPYIGGLVSEIFIIPAFSLSLCLIYLKIADGREIAIGNVFDGFNYFWGAFKVTFLTSLFTFLWTLLFIVPGIIKAYSYSMALYIYADNPDMGALDAINKSREIMNGHKMDLFVLMLSFIGWGLLSVITFGIVGIYAIPYISATYAGFYRSLCDNTQTPEQAFTTDEFAVE